MKHLFRHLSRLSLRAREAWHRTSAPVAFLVALVVGMTAFGAFANRTVPVGPARVEVSAVPALSGSTSLVAPPFGSVSARTHSSPLRMKASLEEIDLPRLQAMAERGVPDAETVSDLTGALRKGAWQALGKGLLAAALASAFVGWSLRHRVWVLLTSTALGVLVPAVLIGWTAVGFDQEAFRKPSYQGALSYAPSLVELVERRVANADDARRQIDKLTGELASYYASPQSFASGGTMDGTFRVLHVSDVHLDPAGAQLVRDLARRFEVGLVIDTGDAVNYGSTVEAAMAARSVVPSVPLVFVPGNHDSPAVVDALRGVEGVTVLEGTSAVVEGLRIHGVHDPMSVSESFEPDTETARRMAEETAEELRAQTVAGQGPDIIAIHDPVMREPLIGLAPLLLNGHTHTPELIEHEGTWMLGAGTTGGVHFSDLRADPHIPHSAAILYYTAEEPRELIAVDQIEMDGKTGRFSLQRSMVEAALLQDQAW